MKQNDITEYRPYCLRSASGRLQPIAREDNGGICEKEFENIYSLFVRYLQIEEPKPDAKRRVFIGEKILLPRLHVIQHPIRQ
jgi:hypothetical protein